MSTPTHGIRFVWQLCIVCCLNMDCNCQYKYSYKEEWKCTNRLKWSLNTTICLPAPFFKLLNVDPGGGSNIPEVSKSLCPPCSVRGHSSQGASDGGHPLYSQVGIGNHDCKFSFKKREWLWSFVHGFELFTTWQVHNEDQQSAKLGRKVSFTSCAQGSFSTKQMMKASDYCWSFRCLLWKRASLTLKKRSSLFTPGDPQSNILALSNNKS